jgi:chaperonin GroES
VKTNLIPLHDRVVVEAIEQSDQTQSGIYIPDAAKERPQTAKVLAVGAGLFQDGSRIPLTVKAGDTVVFAKYSGVEFKGDDGKVLIIRESDILAIVA